MDWQFANLGFALVTKAGVFSLALAAVFYVAWRVGTPHFRRYGTTPKQMKRGLSAIWLVFTVIAVTVSFQRNAPKVVLNPPRMPGPVYDRDAPVKNYNPATKTDAERVEETRRIGRENATEK